MYFQIMDVCIDCDEGSKDGGPLNNFGVHFKDGGEKKSHIHTYLAVLSSMDDLAERL